MYDYIQGSIAEINPAYVVIEAGGIGYILHISLNTYTVLSGQQHVKLYTHQVVREDAHLMFGFAGLEERELFRLLISVSGVGPNTARLLLSSISVDELKQAIVTGHVGMLKSVKGIGDKSAQRIIVDLKDKMDKGTMGPQKVDISHNTIREQSLSGLIVLGFPRKIAEKTIDEVIDQYRKNKPDGSVYDLSVENLIKEALKKL